MYVLKNIFSRNTLTEPGWTLGNYEKANVERLTMRSRHGLSSYLTSPLAYVTVLFGLSVPVKRILS